MAWEAWVLVAVYVVAALSAIARSAAAPSSKPGLTVAVVVVDVGLVWLVLRLAGVS